MERRILEEYARGDEGLGAMLAAIPQRLLDCSALVRTPTGNDIVRVGERVEYAHFLLAGETNVSISTEEGQVSTYLIMRPPTVISDLEVLCGKEHYLASVTAGTDCVTMKCPAGPFLEELHRDVGFLWQVASGACQNNHNLAYNNGQIVYRTGLEKVAYYLLHYCMERPPKGRRKVILEKTQGDVASELAMSAKTVSRSLRCMKEEGYLSIDKKKVVIDEAQYEKLRELGERIP